MSYPGFHPGSLVSRGQCEYFYFDRVILTVVYQWNVFLVSFVAVHRYTRLADLLIIGGARLRDDDMVDRLPIPVVNLECLPVGGQAGSEMQHVPLEPQAQ